MAIIDIKVIMANKHGPFVTVGGLGRGMGDNN